MNLNFQTLILKLFDLFILCLFLHLLLLLLLFCVFVYQWVRFPRQVYAFSVIRFVNYKSRWAATWAYRRKLVYKEVPSPNSHDVHSISDHPKTISLHQGKWQCPKPKITYCFSSHVQYARYANRDLRRVERIYEKRPNSYDCSA